MRPALCLFLAIGSFLLVAPTLDLLRLSNYGLVSALLAETPTATYALIKDENNQTTIQVAGAGSTVTLADVLAGLGSANNNHLVNLGDGKWRLNANLLIDVGVTLNLSPQTGVKELQLRSDSNQLAASAITQSPAVIETDETNSETLNQTAIFEASVAETDPDASPQVTAIDYSTFVYLVTEDGTLNLDGIKLYSWDVAAKKVDENYENGRAYLLARFAATMNIRNAEVAFLGSNDNESYGVSWRDQNDPSTPNTLRTRVTGEMLNSNIFNNYYGVYTYQAQNMRFIGNRFHHNIRYGFDPHDYSHDFLVENNQAYSNGAHGFILSRGCNRFTIRNNKSYNNSDPSTNQAHGFMLDPGGANIDKPQVSSSFNLLENNEAFGNEGFGLRILGSNDNTMRGNNFHHNESGISVESGSLRNVISGNFLNTNTNCGVILRESSQSTAVQNNQLTDNSVCGVYVRSNDNLVTGNIVRQNKMTGIAFAPNLGAALPENNQVLSNTVTANLGSGIDMRQSQKNKIHGNQIDHNGAHGILLDNGAKQNSLRQNVIHNNIGFGISASDAETIINTWSQNAIYANQSGGIQLAAGANQNVAAPVLTGVASKTLNGTARAGATVEVYSDKGAQGQFFEGVATVGADGRFTFSVASNWQGSNLTALTLDSKGNASTFSAPAFQSIRRLYFPLIRR